MQRKVAESRRSTGRPVLSHVLSQHWRREENGSKLLNLCLRNVRHFSNPGKVRRADLQRTTQTVGHDTNSVEELWDVKLLVIDRTLSPQETSDFTSAFHSCQEWLQHQKFHLTHPEPKENYSSRNEEAVKCSYPFIHTHAHTQAVFPHLRDPQSTPLQSVIPAASVFSVPPSSPSLAASEQWPTNPRSTLLHMDMDWSLTNIQICRQIDFFFCHLCR